MKVSLSQVLRTLPIAHVSAPRGGLFPSQVTLALSLSLSRSVDLALSLARSLSLSLFRSLSLSLSLALALAPSLPLILSTSLPLVKGSSPRRFPTRFCVAVYVRIPQCMYVIHARVPQYMYLIYVRMNVHTHQPAQRPLLLSGLLLCLVCSLCLSISHSFSPSLSCSLAFSGDYPHLGFPTLPKPEPRNPKP
jgi:hypothetical protein